MTSILLFLCLLSLSFAKDELCQYDNKATCSKDQYCVHYEAKKDLCFDKYKKELITIAYPFKSSVTALCDQGPLSPAGNSHTWQNTAFAVDLKSSSSHNSEIISGVEGTVIAYDGCKTENDDCGLGFGNQVKILTEDNFIVFYAHLKQVKVKTGDNIKAGTVIGLEGLTGLTGKDNKHLHLSVHEDWKSAGFEYWKNVGYLPKSIPFQIKDCEEKMVSVEKLECKRTSARTYIFCSKNK